VMWIDVLRQRSGRDNRWVVVVWTSSANSIRATRLIGLRQQVTY
jgi:hypothetical protein